MNRTEFTIASAGNTLASALAILRTKGYVVAPEQPNLLRAAKGSITLVGEDPLILLGLSSIAETRGVNWHPTEGEVAALLALEGGNNA